MTSQPHTTGRIVQGDCIQLLKRLPSACIAIKPLILAFSKPGDIVLDPFAGSGTTAAVARKLARRYLAFELDPAYFEIAQRRLAHLH